MAEILIGVIAVGRKYGAVTFYRKMLLPRDNLVAKQPRTSRSRSNPGQESGREATQDKSVPKARISNGRGLPCVPGFVLTDYKSQSRTMGRVLLGFYGRSGDDKCDIIGMYVELSRCEELPVPTLKSEGFPGVTDAPLPDSRNRTPQKDIGQNGGGIRRKACCMKS
ncbi:hypothetical protein V8E54_011489 [Elaphomyces granulatus]